MKPVVLLLPLLVAIVTPTVTPSTSRAEESVPSEAPSLYPIVIENPPTLGKLTTALRDSSGNPIGIECATCHGSPAALVSRPGVPLDFHSGIELAHGELVCNSCHAPDDRTRLRLSSGETLEMEELIRLCAQCHGPQFRSFQNLAHGGSRGYWDRTKGPVIRNNCIACHAAHRPAYPLVRPAAPPNDRFLTRPHREPREPAQDLPPDNQDSQLEAAND
jgi:hypothetical protein